MNCSRDLYFIMGSCLVVQVTLSTDNERKGGSVKNNIVLPEISNTFSKEEEKEEMNVEEELDSLLNSENHSITPVNKRRLSTISNLTIDEAILYLDKQKVKNKFSVSRKLNLTYFSFQGNSSTR